MIYLPPLRRFLVPAFTLLALIVFYRSSLRVPTSVPSIVLHQPPLPPTGIHVPIADLKLHSLPPSNTSKNHLSPASRYFYSYNQEIQQPFNESTADSLWAHPISNPNLDVLWQCPSRANQYTNHIRLPNLVQNISQIPSNPAKLETRTFWNPTILALPYWSENQYLVVSRVVTSGLHQENVLCEANICYTGSSDHAREGEKPCTREDLLHVGPAGGMRCVTAPITLSVPPTPAAKCEGEFSLFTDIPGFHDPRIFWSGKGEPLMMVNTQYVRFKNKNGLRAYIKQIPLRLLWTLADRPPLTIPFSICVTHFFPSSSIPGLSQVIFHANGTDPQPAVLSLPNREKLDVLFSL